MNKSRTHSTSRLRQLVSEAGLYTLGNIVRRSFSVITMPVFTRYLSPSGYGVLAIVGTVQGMLEVLYEMGVSQSSTRFYYDCRDAHQRRTLFGTLLLLSLGIALVLSAVLLIWGNLVWDHIAPDVAFYPFIFLAILTVLFGVVPILPRVVFRVENQVPRFFRLSTAQTLLTVALGVTLVVWYPLGPLGPILASCVVAALFAGVYVWYLRKQVRLAFDWTVARQALSFGLPEVPLRWGSWALKASDRLILQHFTSLSVVGIYSVGYAVGKMPFDLVGNGIHWAMVPFLYTTATQESDERSRQIFSKVATYNILILAALGVVTMLWSGDLILLLASSRYADADSVVPFVVCASFLEAASNIPSKGLYLQRKTPYLLPLWTIPAVLNVGLNFVLIPRFGMIGAAWSTLVGYVIMMVLTLWISQRVYYIPYEYGKITKILGAAVVVAVAGRLVHDVSWPTAIALKLGLLAFFAGLLAVSGVIAASERTLIRSMLPAWFPVPAGTRSDGTA